MSEALLELARRNLDAWNRGDKESWLATARPDAEWHSEVASRVEGATGVYRGHDGLSRYWDEWRSVWDVRLDLTEEHVQGGTVLLVGEVQARGEASGIGLASALALVFQTRDGLIACGRAYFDVAQARRDAGLS